MDAITEIKEKLKGFSPTPNHAITAEVVAIENDTCSVKLDSGLILTDVRLRATIAENEKMLLIEPLIGSDVLVMSQTGDLSGMFVIKVDNASKIKIKNDVLNLQIDCLTGKLTVENQSANLATLINQLIDTISTAQVLTPSGPGTISPGTVSQLTNIKTMFNQLLNTV